MSRLVNDFVKDPIILTTFFLSLLTQTCPIFIKFCVIGSTRLFKGIFIKSQNVRNFQNMKMFLIEMNKCKFKFLRNSLSMSN